MQRFIDRLLEIIRPWYVLAALGILMFGLMGLLGSVLDIDFDRPSHRGQFFAIYGDAGNVFDSLNSRYPGFPGSRDNANLAESKSWLFLLLCAGKFMNCMPPIVLTAFVVGYVGFSLDTGYKWLRKRRSNVSSGVE
jgi:hypothetical protein